MSLYNMLFGRNPYSQILLAMLDLTEGDCGRFRDCNPSEDGKEIVVFTRNGGGNRKGYFPDSIQDHPNYLRDWDDNYDCTYASIAFSVPEQFKEAVAKIADQTNTKPPMEKFSELISNLESGIQNGATDRALAVGKRIVAAIGNTQTTSEIKNPEGSVLVVIPQ